jgi:hypothetical protein
VLMNNARKTIVAFFIFQVDEAANISKDFVREVMLHALSYAKPVQVPVAVGTAATGRCK